MSARPSYRPQDAYGDAATRHAAKAQLLYFGCLQDAADEARWGAEEPALWAELDAELGYDVKERHHGPYVWAQLVAHWATDARWQAKLDADLLPQLTPEQRAVVEAIRTDPAVIAEDEARTAMLARIVEEHAQDPAVAAEVAGIVALLTPSQE